jgi:hypothetical protein
VKQLTLRTSTILISVRNGTQVYRTIDEVPPKLRRKLLQSTSGQNSATILIADRGGRRELNRAIQVLPSGIRARLASALQECAEQRHPEPSPLLAVPLWMKVLIAAGLGLLAWLCVISK